MRSALLLLLAAAGARSEDYVAFSSMATSSGPPARALAATVLQHTVASNAALGRYAWVFGGLDASVGALNDLWMLDLQTGQWAERIADGAKPSARRGASAVVVSQKYAYIFGGESATRGRRQDMFLLHLGSGTSTVPRWEAVVYGSLTMPPSRTEHTATVVPLVHQAGSPLGMIVFGGADQISRPLDDLWEFEFSTTDVGGASGTWRALNPSGTPPSARKGHSACLLLNSLLAIFGGVDQEVPISYADVHLYDLRRNQWMQTTAVGSELPAGRDGHSMVAIEQAPSAPGASTALCPIPASTVVASTVPSPAAPGCRWSTSSAVSMPRARR